MRYQVDSEAVISAAGHARATIARIQSDVATLTSQLHALQGSWSGPAASAFIAVHERWLATQRSVEEGLAGLGQSLASAGAHYQEMEAANTRLFQA